MNEPLYTYIHISLYRSSKRLEASGLGAGTGAGGGAGGGGGGYQYPGGAKGGGGGKGGSYLKQLRKRVLSAFY